MLLCGCRALTGGAPQPAVPETAVRETAAPVTGTAKQTDAAPAESTLTEPAEKAPPTAAEIAALPAGTVLDKSLLTPEITDALFTAEPLSDAVFRRMDGVTYTENPHISRDELCDLRVLHCTPDGDTKIGELIVNHLIADDLLEIFRALYDAAYPIEKILPADEYGGDDDASMADNNSSCFNYRTVPYKETLSYHARGLAVDINPLYNPYIDSGKIMPENAAPYTDRTADFPMKITKDDLCCRLFREHGFFWGGFWHNTPDYQHFEMRIPET